MLQKTRFLLFFLVFFFPGLVFSQGEPVLFSKGNFISGDNISKQTFKKEDIKGALFKDHFFVLVQFATLPSERIQQNLKKAGIELNGYLPGKAYLAAIKKDFDFTLAPSFAFSSINIIPSFYKIDKELDNLIPPSDKQNERYLAVSFYAAIDKATVQEELKKLGAIIISTQYNDAHAVFIKTDKTLLSGIADLPFVSSIHLQNITDKPLNYNSIAAHGASGLHALTGENLNGKGITLGLGDNADISTHVDFEKRLILRTPWKAAIHGTHVGGTLAGAGILDVVNHGFAPRAKVINSFFSNIIAYAPTYVADNNMVVTNNSYYTADQGCPGNGVYDLLSNFLDDQTGNYKELLHVVAAGNDGGFSCAPLPFGFGTIKTGWQCAKNALIVGAINTYDYSVANFSSRGPLKDGRIKPEIMAGGVNVFSTSTNNTYAFNSGTSMACPAATGSVALMYERYRQTHGGANPKAALVKALVCNTAEDLGTAGPDFTTGFGMLNARQAVEAMDSNRYFISSVGNAGNKLHTITVPANTRRLKIMLYWSDTAAVVNAAAALVNDLDLTVTEPSALVHRPLILNPAPQRLNDVAAEGTDHTNNIEQVVLDNPAAGVYSINVKGFAVPFGPQEYVISYEIINPSVIVEYPRAGETMVPGESENIRWNAYGNDANNFTIEYSSDNGTTWTIIDNNVPAITRIYPWTVPLTATARALIRISRNGTALTGTSKANFIILPRPVMYGCINVCEGAVKLLWSGIPAATSYDVLQLSGDTMKVIANTTDTILYVKGLDKNTTAGFGIAAKLGNRAGRRSLSVWNVTYSGQCNNATFYNDIEVDSILEPNTARQNFANEAAATNPVKILIKNLGNIPVSGPFTVSFQYQQSVITETINTTIAAKGNYTYTFTGMYPVTATGFSYDFKAWATLAADSNHLNDTAYKTVRYINNDPLVLPVAEGFETLTDTLFYNRELGIDNDKFLDFYPDNSRGRGRSFVNSDFPRTGTRAFTLDQPYGASPSSDTLLLNYNLFNYKQKQVRFDFYYKNHGQDDAAGNRIWIRGSENDAWVQAFDLFASQAGLGEWQHGFININDVLANAVPSQTMSKTFQMKIGQEGLTSANLSHPLNDLDDGYTFDDLRLSQAFNDVSVTKIISPDKSDCVLSAANAISIRIKNYDDQPLLNIPVNYRINGGPVITEIISSIAADQTMDYVFNQKADLSAYADDTISVWVNYPADSYRTNDSIVNYIVRNTPMISNYPYLQGFETNDGYFYTRGTNSSWAWGIPAKTVINKAPNGSKAWVTSLTGNYSDNETSYLYSPCFDLSGLAQPVLSFSHLYQVEAGYDYTWVEYSTNGVVWQKLGVSGSGTNWYDDTTLRNWGISNTKWHCASYDLPTGIPVIRLRFVLSSDGGTTEEGVGIDDIHVFDKAPVYTGAPITGITQNVSGNNWVHFLSGGNRLVSINANGANLGATTIQVHPFSGLTRTSKNQYYANRNIVLRPTNTPAGSVSVRFYFTEVEAQNLINAGACPSCLKPFDPYEFGVTKYSGNAADENGSLDDDVNGFLQFIPPANSAIVPYDNGYYAEFSVNNFSEFWLSAAKLQPEGSGDCPGSTIIFTAGSGTSFKWQKDSGSGYTDITSGPKYAGINTNTLQLINLPTSYSGYKYRCVVDGVNGADKTVRFTSVWGGSANTNWFTPANWNCGLVPDQYTDVVIPGGVSNYPFVTGNATIKSISVHPGAPVTVSSGVILDIRGN